MGRSGWASGYARGYACEARYARYWKALSRGQANHGSHPQDEIGSALRKEMGRSGFEPLKA